MLPEGIWLPGKAVPESGSMMVGRPAKFPLRMASVATESVLVREKRSRRPS